MNKTESLESKQLAYMGANQPMRKQPLSHALQVQVPSQPLQTHPEIKDKLEGGDKRAKSREVAEIERLRHERARSEDFKP